MELWRLFFSLGVLEGIQYSSFHVISSSEDNSAQATSPGYLGHNVAKIVQAQDKTIICRDLRVAHKFLFESIYDMMGSLMKVIL